MEINIEIDGLTNCLIKRTTDEECDTQYRLVSKTITKAESFELQKQGWLFDWSIPQIQGSNGIYQGVGAHLFAIACKLSWDVGNEGFIQFTAKTALVEHYKNTLNAKSIDAQNMYIDNYSALNLIKTYFSEEV